MDRLVAGSCCACWRCSASSCCSTSPAPTPLVDRNIQSCDEAVEVEVERFLVEDLGIATLAKCRQRHRAALEIMTIAGPRSMIYS